MDGRMDGRKDGRKDTPHRSTYRGGAHLKSDKGQVCSEKFRILEISIHRSVDGIFIRSYARIEPTIGKFLDETDFVFFNCRVIPIFGSQ